jgi:hypothetical protein
MTTVRPAGEQFQPYDRDELQLGANGVRAPTMPPTMAFPRLIGEVVRDNP